MQQEKSMQIFWPQKNDIKFIIKSYVFSKIVEWMKLFSERIQQGSEAYNFAVVQVPVIAPAPEIFKK